MGSEESYFKTLMEENGFEVVNEKFIQFLNKHIKKHLSLYIHIHRYRDEHGETKYLNSLVPSPTVFLIKHNNWIRIEKVGLLKYVGMDEYAKGRIEISEVSLDGERLYPAYSEYSPFPVPHPTNSKMEIVNHPDYQGDMYKPGVITVDIENVFLSKDDFFEFKKRLFEKENNKVIPRRLNALKLHLERKLNRKIVHKLQRDEHPYRSRSALWKELHDEYDPKLFKWPASKKTIDSLFDSKDNNYISFNSKKLKENLSNNPINSIKILKF
jgi:hypothetical protein